jgi:hypothetical protein
MVAGAEYVKNDEIVRMVISEEMVVGEGLLSAMRFALRVVAYGNAFSLRSNRTLVEASHPSQ